MLQQIAKPVSKRFVTGILAVGIVTAGIFLSRDSLVPSKTPTEIKKLFHVLALYQKKDCKVLYNGNLYEIAKAVGKARLFIASRYRGEKAQVWIRNHLYRSPDEGKIIYLVAPDGVMRPLADVLLEELHRLFPV